MANSDCPTTSTILPPEEKKIFEYRNIAKKSCRLVGGITEMNFCPNQKYLRTVTTKASNFDICVEIYQCVGFSWKCSRSDGGYIE